MVIPDKVGRCPVNGMAPISPRPASTLVPSVCCVAVGRPLASRSASLEPRLKFPIPREHLARSTLRSVLLRHRRDFLHRAARASASVQNHRSPREVSIRVGS